MRLRTQRHGRAFTWFLAAAVVVVGGLAAWRLVPWPHDDGDPVLLREIGQANLGEEQEAREPSPSDWPRWRGANFDGIAVEPNLLTTWPAGGPKVLWEAKTGSGYSGIAVADGRAVTLFQDGDSEAVVCWQADTGKELWRFRYPCQYENGFGSGPRATPTVAGGHVYTVGATGLLHCLKADSGAKVWHRDLLDEFKASNLSWGVSFSPLVDGNLVFTNPGGPGGGSLVAFDAKSGKLVWKAEDDAAGYASPTLATLAKVRQVVYFTAQGLVGVTPQEGKVLWRFPWTTSYDANIATPICLGDYVFISTGYGKGCAVVKVEAEGGALTAKRVYEHNRMRNHFSTGVLHKEHLYGFDEDMLVCMEFRTGKVVWKQRGFQKGTVLVANDHLIILGEQGKLALAEATPSGFKQKASCQFSDNKCWTVPTLAQGRLYVRDEETIRCYNLRK